MIEKLKKNLNKIIILIVIVFVLTFVYNYINNKEIEDISETVIGEESTEAREILETLNELERIEIDYNFFYNKEYQGGDNLVFVVEGKEYSLKDFSQKELSPKDFGKANPFIENTFSNSFVENNSLEENN